MSKSFEEASMPISLSRKDELAETIFGSVQANVKLDRSKQE